DRNLPIEPTRAQQSRVQNVRAVRRRDQDDATPRVEAVHLDEQLVQGLFPLVVATADTRTALPPDRVELVDEDDAGRVVLRLLEHVTHPGGTDTDEHFHEVRTGDRVEGHTRLAGHGARQQRLSGTGWSVEQHTLRNLRAECLVPGGLLQEI